MYATEDAYGASWGLLFPEAVKAKNPRSSSNMAFYNLISLLTTILVGAIGGIVNGCLLKMKCFEPAEVRNCFDDEWLWEVEDTCILAEKK